ncbi:DUF4328 domain-containing protein [Streptomyces roseochromogenus]|uniref:DUF4328 domain-containing protein n=1 Tax=Streptomyces roseochromogenus subsp. oscitans DS 12.976 TaxID=1352936 RepID=V6JIA6_STRRC|nr:DUF4328 domain-containing protein [Streptomyces roseochromogenus]EST19585.1 hypothetical protein M878_41915 [Streptomyces roseochromogenus subsp. oscitans DS 12.976]
MTGSTPQAPWFLARSAQFTVAAAAGVEWVRALKVRAHLLHPSASTAAEAARVSMIYVYVMTAAVVLFLVWFAGCRRNAELLSPGAVRGSAAWAVLAWLIPGINFWAPRGLLLDVRRASGPAGADPGRGDLLVNAWWAAWLGHAVLSLVGTQVAGGTSLPLLVAAQALDVPAAALAVTLIERITKRQAAGLRTVEPVPAPEGLPHAS